MLFQSARLGWLRPQLQFIDSCSGSTIGRAQILHFRDGRIRDRAESVDARRGFTPRSQLPAPADRKASRRPSRHKASPTDKSSPLAWWSSRNQFQPHGIGSEQPQNLHGSIVSGDSTDGSPSPGTGATGENLRVVCFHAPGPRLLIAFGQRPGQNHFKGSHRSYPLPS